MLKVQHYDAISILNWNDRKMTSRLQQSERLNMKIETKLGQENGQPASVQEHNQHMTESKSTMRFFNLTSNIGRKYMLHKNIQKTDKCHNPNVIIIRTENFTGNEN